MSNFNLTVIGTLGGPESRVFAIDGTRRLAGDSDAAPNNDRHAMLFDNGSQDLGVLVIPNPLGIPLPGIPLLDMSSARGIGRLANGGTLIAGFSSKILLAGPLSTIVNRGTVWINGNPIDMGTLIPGPNFVGMTIGNSQGFGVNSRGLVAGMSDIATLGPNLLPLHRGIVFDANQGRIVSVLPTLAPDPANPGAFLGNSEALGLNDLGQVVGVSDTGLVNPSGDPIRHGFVFDLNTGQMRDLGTLITAQINPGRTDTNSEARAINNKGQVVGVSDSLDSNSNPVQRAFLFDPNPPFAGMQTMNDLGTLQPANRPPNMLHHGRVFCDQGNSEANAINDAGIVVGTADIGQIGPDGEPIRHGFKWDPATRDPEDLNNPPLPGPWTIIEATGINSAGDICGQGVDVAGLHRGLLLFL